MSEVDDKHWRMAARLLGLELTDAEGRKVAGKRGTRAHEMRGAIDGRDVTVRCGLNRTTDGTIVIEVRAARSLLLGLRAHAYRGASRQTPGLISLAMNPVGPLFTDFAGIEQERVNAMLTTNAGAALAESLRALGRFGWVEITDRRLLTHSELRADEPREYAEVVWLAVRLLREAEAARAALGESAWEQRLRSGLDAIAGELHLDLDRDAFAVRGTVRGAAVSLRLEAAAEYALVGNVRFSRPLEPGSRLAPRKGFWSWCAGAFGLDRPARDAAFDRAFRVEGPLRGRLSTDIVRGALGLAREAALTVTAEGIVTRTRSVEIDAAQHAARLVELAQKVTTNADGSPYRDGPLRRGAKAR